MKHKVNIIIGTFTQLVANNQQKNKYNKPEKTLEPGIIERSWSPGHQFTAATLYPQPFITQSKGLTHYQTTKI